MRIDAVVADASVLLSAVIGKAALRVFVDHSVDVHVSQFNAKEVEKYIPQLCQKFDLARDVVVLQWKLFPLIAHTEEHYVEHLGWSRESLAERDPDDAHPLALARALALSLWANDRDLEGHGVECYPTARLLALPEGSASPP